MSMTCYGYSSPNVVVLPNYGPCNPRAGSISLCCEFGDTCLANGLCVTPSGVYYNGGCTDDTYQSATCPQYCTTGDANWVIRCPSGSAVKAGDFCCFANGTTSTCCNTPSSGLGLVAAESSVEAVSTSNGANAVPAYISSGATTSTSKNIASPTMSTSCPTDQFLDLSHVLWDNKSGVPIGLMIGAMIGLMAYPVSLVLWAIVKWIKRWSDHNFATIKRQLIYWSERRDARRLARFHETRQAEANNSIAMHGLRDRRVESEGLAPPGPSTRGQRRVNPNEFEGSQAEPVATDASQTHLAAAGPSSAGPSTPRAPEGNPPAGPRARAQSFVSAGLTRR